LICSYRLFRDEDQAGLEELLKNAFPSFRDSNLWSWKYRLNPNFHSSLVVIAEKDGKIVGSNYWLSRDLKLSSTVQIRAALAADVVVHPDYRGRGIGSELVRFPRLSGAFKQKGIVLSYSLVGRSELVERFYHPFAGYTSAPSDTITYRKLFSCQELREKFEEIDQAIKSNAAVRKQLKDVAMSISFKLRGAPQFSVHIQPERVYLEEGKTDNSDVIVEGSLSLSSLIIEGEVSVGDLVKSWLTGKIKIRRGLLHVFKLRKAFTLFQAAFDQKSAR
jgi:predicted N-acetyltransferase YhbS